MKNVYMKKMTNFVAISLSVVLMQSPVFARDTIQIVGSSTVYPFSKAVAKRFSQITKLNIPEIKSTGSGGGFKLFCEGVGEKFPDITNASRRMSLSELEACASNGVGEVTEVLIGYDGISIATSVLVDKFKFTDRDLYLAVAKYVPNGDGKFVKNPFTTWRQINPSLPDVEIKVYGPHGSSGTNDAFVELALSQGAKRFDFLSQLNKFDASKKTQIQSMISNRSIPVEYWQGIVKKKAENAKGSDLLKSLVSDFRDDGVYIQSGENDSVIINSLVENPNSIGVIGYGFLLDNQKKVQASVVNDIEPSIEGIAKGSYSLSRGLYFYIKKAHVELVPGIKEFTNIFLSRIEVGKGGYLESKGLIVMDAETYSTVKKGATNLDNLKL